MTLPEFVSTYGYAAVLAGALLEGESVLLLAGFAAHQGLLSLHWVVLIAFAGGTVGDQVFFWIGRRWGTRLLEHFPRVQARVGQVGVLLRRWDASLVFAIRFMYGLRIAGPIAMGALGFAPRRFALFNALGAAVWAVVITGAGYLLGRTVDRVLREFEGYEGRVLWGALLIVVLFVGVTRTVRALRARAARSD
jgi:membrane protein DedA with SNARE-associated domain